MLKEDEAVLRDCFRTEEVVLIKSVVDLKRIQSVFKGTRNFLYDSEIVYPSIQATTRY